MAVVFAFVAIVSLYASQPSWWASRGAVNTSATRNDNALATEGQLKQFTLEGVREMNDNLPIGSGTGLNTLVNGWISNYATYGYSGTNPKPSDFQVMDIGQLKYIGGMVWTQLEAGGYVSSLPSWLVVTSSDAQVANLGQLKTVFDFDLTGTDAAQDTNSDGIPDWWENYYLQTLSVTSTTAVLVNGGTTTLLQAWQQHIDPLPAPVFSPPGGLLRSSTNVTISATGTDAIYFTTNGSDPAVSGSLYSTSIPVSGFETLRAIAYRGSVSTQEGAAVYSVVSNPVIAAGTYHSLAIRADGTVWAWGTNNYGQLGTGDLVDQWYPAQVSLSSSATSVAGGAYHSLAVTSNGQVWAWGENNHDQLGTASSSLAWSDTPTMVTGGTSVIEVAAGAYHSVALTSGSKVLAWGADSDGQVGNGTTTSATSTPVLVSISGTAGVTKIAAGGNFTLALTSARTVWAWGDNTDGECCQGSTGGSYDSPTSITNSHVSNIVAIAAGDQHALALTGSGTVWAWGYNNCGQLGNNSTTTSGSAVQVLTASSGTLTNVISIAAGTDFSIAVKGDGTVWEWGNIDAGALGTGNILVATQVTGVSGAELVATGLHALVAGSNGSVTAFGLNGAGELGVGNNTSSVSPLLSQAFLSTQPPAPTFSPDSGFYSAPQSVLVACSDSLATIYYTVDGSTPGPGNGTRIISGQSLSIGSATMLRACAFDGAVSSQPKSAAYHMGYQIVGAGVHSVLLDTNGTVYTWGGNSPPSVGLDVYTSNEGALGLGWESDNQIYPQLVAGLPAGAIAIGSGKYNTAAVINSGSTPGTVWVCGDNSGGQCDEASSTGNFYTPVESPGVSDAIAVACGWSHTVALTGSGTVVGWGNNGFGQLGNGTTTSGTIPITAIDLPGIKAIAAGEYHTLALSSTGTVYAWGYNNAGQLGIGTTTASHSPVQVPGLNNIIEIAACGNSSYALRSDGTVWAWGSDTDDMLADDLDSYEASPVLVGTMRDVVAISAGADHAVALLGNGTTLTWGLNVNDAIVSGASSPSLPMPVSGVALVQGTVSGVTLVEGTTSLPSVVTSVSAGDDHTLMVLNTEGVQTLWAWGDNLNGQLGDGTYNSQYPPPVMIQFSGYSANQSLPDWLALELGLNPNSPGTNSTGIPIDIAFQDGEGINPSLPYTPYTLTTGTTSIPAPTIYITIPSGVVPQ